MALKDTWTNKVDGQDYVMAEDINSIAEAVIELEVGENTVLSDNLFDKTSILGAGVFSYDSTHYQLVEGGDSRYAFVPLRGAGTYRTLFNTVEHEWSGARIALTNDDNEWVMNATGTITPTDKDDLGELEFTVTQDMINNGAAKIAFDVWVGYLDTIMIVKDRDYPDKYIPYGYIEVTTDDAKKVPNILTEKTAVFLGDSICAASTEYEGAMAGYGWAGLIGEANDMVWKNYGKDGGTITDLGEVGLNVWLSTQLNTAYAEHPDANYVIFEGGCNDADRMGDALLGEISTGYDTFDTTTFSGAFESLVLNILNKYPAAKVGYIIPPKMYYSSYTPDHTAANHVHRRFFDRAVEICQKWGIPVIDLWNGCPMNPKLTIYYDNSISITESNAAGKYYTDGQHLTITGYKYIAPLIEAWMRNLYINGDVRGGGSDKNSIYYVEGKSITAGTWLGTSEDITEYYDGLTVAYKTNVIGASGGTTLNINGLGAVSVVRNNNTVVSSQYVPGSILILTYTTDTNGTSYWKIADYDDDKKTSSSNKASTKMFLVGATSQSSNGVTTNTNSNCYIGTDNSLYSNGEKVASASDVVQSDLTQNDETAPDYVKGRTHYVAETVVFPETTLTVNDETGMLMAETDFTFEDKTYIVYWNGARYESKGMVGAGGLTICGNLTIAGQAGASDTGEPFVIMTQGGMIAALSVNGETTITLKISTETVHQIDPKFVPNLPYSETVKTILPLTEYELTGTLIQGEGGFDFETGKPYTVVFNGIEYDCFGMSAILPYGEAIALGNPTLSGIYPIFNTGEPFIIAYVPALNQYSIQIDSDIDELINSTISVAIYEKPIHPLSKEYLPNQPLIVECKADATLSEIVAVKSTIGEIVKAYSDGCDIVLRVVYGMKFGEEGSEFVAAFRFSEYWRAKTNEGSFATMTFSNLVVRKAINIIVEHNYEPTEEAYLGAVNVEDIGSV